MLKRILTAALLAAALLAPAACTERTTMIDENGQEITVTKEVNKYAVAGVAVKAWTEALRTIEVLAVNGAIADADKAPLAEKLSLGQPAMAALRQAVESDEVDDVTLIAAQAALTGLMSYMLTHGYNMQPAAPAE